MTETPAPSHRKFAIIGLLIFAIPAYIHTSWIMVAASNEHLTQSDKRALFLNGLPGSPTDTVPLNIIVAITCITSIVMATLGRRESSLSWRIAASVLTGLAGFVLLLQLFQMM